MVIPRRRYEVVSVLHHRSLPEPEVERSRLFWTWKNARAYERRLNAHAFRRDNEQRRLNALAGTEYLNPSPGTWYEWVARPRKDLTPGP